MSHCQMGFQGYDLTWFDEFDGDKLDRTNGIILFQVSITKARTQMHFTGDPANVFKDGILHLTALSIRRNPVSGMTKQKNMNG